MTNFQFLQQYVDLQNDVMYDQIINLDFAKVGYCIKDSSSFWNMALVDNQLSDQQLLKIETTLEELDRKPALYFEKREDLSAFIESIQNNGYKKTNEDCWMFYESTSIDKKNFNIVKKVATEDDLVVFLKTFDNCYRKNDPQNPYGELGEYLDVTRDAWVKHKNTNRIEYFIIYKGDQPVAVSTLNSFKNIGYISNVGSLPSVRGEGFGKLATLFCVQASRERGSTSQCLTTEEGNYPHEFYKRIGFTFRFSALLFVKNDE